MLSVIIPVYLTEASLDRCVSSVLSQQTDLEVVLVDDGSPDRCPQLCDEWEQRDQRVRVIHRANGGLSAARNTGIGAARGEYVTFVDSDDYLSPDTYPALMKLFHTHPEYDIIEFGLVRFEGSDREEEVLFSDEVYTDSQRYWLQGQAYDHSYAWNKVYSRWLFDHVRFPEGRVFEDVQTLPLLLRKARCVATVTMGCYHYCHNPKGITALAGADEIGILLHAHISVLRRLLRDDVATLDADGALSRYYLSVVNIQITFMRLSGKAPEIPPYRFRIPREMSFRAALKARLVRLLGLKRFVKWGAWLPV